MDLIPESLKAEIDNVFDDIHDTFKQTVYVYVTQETSLPVSADFNPLFGRGSSTAKSSTDRVEVKHEIQARVFYLGNAEEREPDSSLNIPDSEGKVRLKVKEADMELVYKASKLEVDGVLYRLFGDPKVAGMFSNKFWVVILERIN